MKFILTSELNKLAKKLRFLGFNSTVCRSLSSHITVRLAITEERILLTRSVKLFKDKRQFKRFLVVDSDPIKQLEAVFKEYKLCSENIFTICPECNHNLHPITVDKIAIELPPKVLANYSEFKVCRNCGHYYWKGTHYDRTIEHAQQMMELYD